MTVYREPEGEGVRVDGALYEGGQPSVHYDPLVGKLICFAPGEGDAAFQAAREKTIDALGRYHIEGIKTNVPLLRGILRHPEFIKNEVFLTFMERHGKTLAATPAPEAAPSASASSGTGRNEKVSVEAPIEAVVIDIPVKVGASVHRGDLVALLSAMKLETEVVAPHDGTVLEICVETNATVSSGQGLVVLDAFVPDASASSASHGRQPEAQRSKGGARVGSAVDSSEIWYSADAGVVPCDGPSSSSLQLLPPRKDDAFSKRQALHEALSNTLKERLASVAAGGGETAVAQHRKRNKMLPRERIQAVIDEGTKFIELSPLAAWEMYDGSIGSAGIVTGVGLVHGREVLFVANDATVKGGTYFPLTVKKHLRAQQIALENRLPCVYLVDSGGAFLPLQDEVFPDQHHFGRIFYNQAQMSAQGIPQISAVLGSCTAGGAYVPAMSDENIIVKGNGTIFLGGPPLVKASTGESVTAEELGGADVHTSISGVADHFAEDEPAALAMCRQILAHAGEAARPAEPELAAESPLLDPEELLGIVPEDNSKALDIRQIIARVTDGSRFHEFKKRYGSTLVCGFAHIHGYPVGIVANNGILFAESALKGSLVHRERRDMRFWVLGGVLHVGSEDGAQGGMMHVESGTTHFLFFCLRTGSHVGGSC